MGAVMEHVMEGGASPAQIAGLLVALRMKGEFLGEIVGAARVMRRKAAAVPCRARAAGLPLVDLVGTGGDGTGSFNVSTTAALVVAGAGVRVAKHGNRAVTSRSGSADLMAALGVPLDLTPEEIGRCIDQVGLGFLYAPALHPALRHAAAPRRELGLRTLFNLLGPLCNPAGADVLVLGVAEPSLVERLAQALARLGTREAWVVHGEGGYDELTVTGSSQVARLKDGRLTRLTLTPEALGFGRAQPEELACSGPAQSRELTLAILHGAPGPRRDMVLLTAAALVAAGAAPDLPAGVALAGRAIDSGAALAKLEELLALTQGLTAPRAAEA